MIAAVCMHCGVKANAETAELLEQAVPGHPFLTGRCPKRARVTRPTSNVPWRAAS